MSATFEIATMPAQPTVSVRFRSAVQDLPQHFDPAFTRLFGYLGETGEPPAGAPFGAYHNMDMQDLDVEVGIPVARPLPSQGEVLAAELPTRRVATGVHSGAYDGLPAFHGRFMAWCNANGHTVNGPVYEFYVTNPSDTPADQLQTRVEYTLESADERP